MSKLLGYCDYKDDKKFLEIITDTRGAEVAEMIDMAEIWREAKTQCEECGGDQAEIRVHGLDYIMVEDVR